MGRFEQAVADSIQSGLCAFLIASDANTEFYNRLYRLPPDFLNVGAYLQRGICDIPGPTNVPASFQGGQCVGVLYRVTAQGRTFGSNGTSVREGIGPVEGMCFGAPNQFGATAIGVRFAGSGCVTAGTGNANCSPTDQGTWNITSIERVDGQPDQCAPTPAPTEPFTVTGPLVWIDNSGQEINETITTNIFAPFLLLGNLIAPITVQIGPINLKGNITLAPKFSIDLLPTEVEETPEGDSDGEIEPGIDDNTDVECNSSERTIIGAVIRVTSLAEPKVTTILQGSNPDIYVPRLGNINFFISVSGGCAWSEDIPVRSVNQYIHCPTPLGAIAVRGTPSQGVSWEITPIYDQE